jgi:adenylate kinase family enzyme
MLEHQRYITPETAAKTVLTQLPPDSRLIVTGQIGCGKTTLAREISIRLGLTHLEIDGFHKDANPKLAAARAASSIDGGWVAEANVWQIPQAIWETADVVIFLDYSNAVHYLRILRRCFHKCLMKPTWARIRDTVSGEMDNAKIVYLYANKNREEWREHVGITNTATPVIRCASPRVTNRLLTCWPAGPRRP